MSNSKKFTLILLHDECGHVPSIEVVHVNGFDMVHALYVAQESCNDYANTSLVAAFEGHQKDLI